MITFAPEDITAILGYIGEIVGDFMPLIVIFFGIAIGFWVVDKVLHRKKED